VDTSLLSHYAGSTCELDSQPGRYNPGMQWLASGVLEWVRQLLWTPETPWQTLIEEAGPSPRRSEGEDAVRPAIQPNRRLAGRHAEYHPRSFLPRRAGRISRTAGAQSANAGKIGHFKARELLLVGGGSRNALWNQIKANRLEIPIKVLDDAETTVAGAAMFGWYGVGEFSARNRPERR
jgi:L-fuculokinase